MNVIASQIVIVPHVIVRRSRLIIKLMIAPVGRGGKRIHGNLVQRSMYRIPYCQLVHASKT